MNDMVPMYPNEAAVQALKAFGGERIAFAWAELRDRFGPTAIPGWWTKEDLLRSAGILEAEGRRQIAIANRRPAPPVDAEGLLWLIAEYARAERERQLFAAKRPTR